MKQVSFIFVVAFCLAASIPQSVKAQTLPVRHIFEKSLEPQFAVQGITYGAYDKKGPGYYFHFEVDVPEVVKWNGLLNADGEYIYEPVAGMLIVDALKECRLQFMIQLLLPDASTGKFVPATGALNVTTPMEKVSPDETAWGRYEKYKKIAVKYSIDRYFVQSDQPLPMDKVQVLVIPYDGKSKGYPFDKYKPGVPLDASKAVETVEQPAIQKNDTIQPGTQQTESDPVAEQAERARNAGGVAEPGLGSEKATPDKGGGGTRGQVADRQYGAPQKPPVQPASTPVTPTQRPVTQTSTPTQTPTQTPVAPKPESPTPTGPTEPTEPTGPTGPTEPSVEQPAYDKNLTGKIVGTGSEYIVIDSVMAFGDRNTGKVAIVFNISNKTGINSASFGGSTDGNGKSTATDAAGNEYGMYMSESKRYDLDAAATKHKITLKDRYAFEKIPTGLTEFQTVKISYRFSAAIRGMLEFANVPIQWDVVPE